VEEEGGQGQATCGTEFLADRSAGALDMASLSFRCKLSVLVCVRAVFRRVRTTT